MNPEKQIVGRYRAMRAWVARERWRLERTGERPSQRYLRRARLVDDVDLITLRELVRELRLLRTAR
jgi:hypothetical protein